VERAGLPVEIGRDSSRHTEIGAPVDFEAGMRRLLRAGMLC